METVDGLKAQKIKLISLEEKIDTTSAAGELVFHVFGVITHFKRQLISERTKDGLENTKKHGRNPGRPPLQEETISTLKGLVEAGKSVSKAAKHLGFGRPTAYKVISRAKVESVPDPFVLSVVLRTNLPMEPIILSVPHSSIRH